MGKKHKIETKPVNQTQPDNPVAVTSPGLSVSFTVFVFVVVGLSGGAIMLLELLGTRLLAPVFGSSLYIWTALIAVTLLSLALGYPTGGIVADRFPQKYGVLFAIILAAATWLLLLAFLQDYILQRFIHTGPRSGPLLASFLLFTIPLLLLAMTGPLAVKFLTAQLGCLGITVGKVSAISTLGSLAGTLVTGFYLIPEVGSWKTLWYLGLVLFLVAGLGFFWLKRLKIFVAILIIASISSAAIGFPEPIPRAPRKLLLARTSPYSDIRILETTFIKHEEYATRPWRTRILFLGHGLHTIQFRDWKTNEPCLPPLQERVPLYWDTLRLLPLLRDNLHSCLLIGLGGGTMLEFLRASGITDIDVVEIDPLVVQVAREYFACAISSDRLFIQDARFYVKHCRKKYDIILSDAFGAGTAPFHLFSVEALAELKQLLHTDGVLYTNYIGFFEKDPAALASLYITLKEVFPYHLVTYPVQNDHNFVFFSSQAPLGIPPAKLTNLAKEDKQFINLLLANHATLSKGETETPNMRIALERHLNLASLIPVQAGKMISDAQNALEILNISQNEYLRHNTLRNYGDIFFARWQGQ